MSQPSLAYAEVSHLRDPLGVTLVPGGVNVAIFAEHATAVDFCVRHEDGSESRWALPEKARGIWHGFVPGIEAGTRYGFRVHGPWNPAVGHRHNPHKWLIDPYARAIDGNWVMHEAMLGYTPNPSKPGDESRADDRDSAPFMPSAVVVADDFDWTGDIPVRHPWHESMVYEVHVKGMTMQNPAVPEHLRGTYLGLCHESVIEYLLSIGVTAVELLPIHQIGHEEHLVRTGKVNYWGYNTLGYFAPHHAYASSSVAGQQVNEFKQMVKTFHQAGIEVILDVVYNHTAEGGPRGPMMSFKGIDNSTYYRLAADPQHYFDTTGCSNTLNTAHPQVMQLVLDSLRYWVEEMHVDGFRFDLATALARNSQNNVDMTSPMMQAIGQDPVLRRVRLIAEPWDIGHDGYQVGNYPRLWSEWNDQFRDTARDFWRGRSAGVSKLASRLSGSADIFMSSDRSPRSSINYITAHDGFTLRDLVSYDVKHNLANGEGNRDGSDENRSWNHGTEGETPDPAINNLRRQQQRNLIATLMLATGVPMLTAGDENGRTQQGNNNAYCQDNKISWLDWDLSEDRRELLDFTRNVMSIRQANPVFHGRKYRLGDPTESGGPKDLAWFTPNGTELVDHDWADLGARTLGMYLNRSTLNGDTESDCSFLVLLHAGADPIEFRLPDGHWGKAWQPILDTTVPNGQPVGTIRAAGTVLNLAGRSLLVLQEKI